MCLSITCGSGKLLNSAKYGTVHDGRISTCCTTRAKCSTIGCPAGKKPITDNAKIYCAKSVCTTTGAVNDVATCCVTDASKCLGSTFTCGAFRFRDTAKNAINGNTDTACCSPRAKCSSVTCVAGKKKIAAAATTYCAGLACTTSCTGSGCTTERDSKCCENDVKKCGGTSVTCTVGKYKDTAKYNTVGTTDLLCCSNSAKCTTITCAAGMKKKFAHATTYCAAATCVTTDQSTCCEDDDTKCKGVTVSCPTCKYKATSTNGNSAGKYNCCTGRALCSTMTCSAGMKKKTAHATTYCAKSGCISVDRPTCCENIAGRCIGATVTCAAGKFKDPAKYGVAGATAALCCSNMAKCSSVTCGTGMRKIAAAATTYCAGASCTTAEYLTCCENDPTRCQWSGVACGVGKYKDTSKYSAVGTTAAQCCGTAALCTTLTCPTALKQIAANTTTYCHGATCGSTMDIATCCTANPALTACSAFTGTLLKCGPGHYKNALYNHNVVIEHNYTVKCCTNKALCTSLTCGAGKKQITAAATTYCVATTCATVDSATCCETDTTKCLGASVSCAAGQFKDPAKNNAKGTTATTCCSDKAKCSAIACAAGTKKVSNAAGIYCAGGSCLFADQANCCVNDATKCRGSCVQCAVGSYKDPLKYGSLSGANAQAACCATLAKCSSITCLAGQKHKSNAASTYCATKTCATADRSTCCENDSRKCLGATVTCGSKKYKDSAHNGWLKGCDAVVSCCSSKARCSTLACPAGKQLKDNSYDTYCATKTCGTADITTCCDPDATVCAGATVSCPAGKYKDSAKGHESVTDVKTACCTARSVCLPQKPYVNATGAVAGAPRAAMTSVFAPALALMVIMVAAAY